MANNQGKVSEEEMEDEEDVEEEEESEDGNELEEESQERTETFCNRYGRLCWQICGTSVILVLYGLGSFLMYVGRQAFIGK